MNKAQVLLSKQNRRCKSTVRRAGSQEEREDWRGCQKGAHSWDTPVQP